MPPTYEPMLATPASSLRHLPPGPWRLEPKLDGWRALAYLHADGSCTIRSRRGRDLTDRLPELHRRPASLLGRTAVLDGELVVGSGSASDFYRVGPRLARSSKTAEHGCPVHLVAFDLLWLDDQPLHARPYLERRAQLEALDLQDGCWRTAETFDADPAALLAACARLDIEGLVAKRLHGLYRPGKRSSDWIKIKTPAWQQHHGPRRLPV